MAHFTRVKALGWAIGEELLSALMNQLDSNVEKAINGDDGGTWAPAAPIVLDGAGLQIDSVLSVSTGGALTIETGASVVIEGNATVRVENTVATRYIDSTTVTFEDTAQLRMQETSTIAFSGTSTCTYATGTSCTFNTGSTLALAGSAAMTVSGTATCTFATGTTLTCNSGSTVSVAGAFTATSTSMVTLAGRRVLRRARVTVTDASQSINVGQGDLFKLPANNAAPRTITLSHTGTVPTAGETLTFLWTPAGAGGGGTQYTFQREDTTVVATFVGAQVADTGAVSAEFEFVGGVWRLSINSGTPNEYTTGPEAWTSYGVVPGAGA